MTGVSTKRRGRPSKRKLRRELLVTEATRLFNSKGIAAVGLSDIAQHLNLSRASIYHYVNSRSDLVFLCYQRSCEQMADDLLEASTEGHGLNRLVKFISLTLTPERPPFAVLSEINALDDDIKSTLNRDHSRNMRHLIRIINDGISDKSIRQCDPEIVGHSIYGILSWAQLLSEWTSGDSGDDLRARTSNALNSLLCYGLLTSKEEKTSFDFDIASFRRKRGNLFDKSESSEAKVEIILAIASKLFNRESINAVSLDKIAFELGVTKGVIYHYFEHKDELVIKSYERAFGIYEQFIEYADNFGKTGIQKALINAHLNIQAKISDLSPLMPEVGFSSLPSEKRKQFQTIAKRQNRKISDFLRNGLEDGSTQKCDAGLVTHICAGAFAWMPKWRPNSDARSSNFIADEICKMIFAGISTGKPD